MIYRIIDKQTKLFKRDDIIWNKETERAVADKCPQGFNEPIWAEEETHDLETDTMILVGHWEDNNPQ